MWPSGRTISTWSDANKLANWSSAGVISLPPPTLVAMTGKPSSLSCATRSSVATSELATSTKAS